MNTNGFGSNILVLDGKNWERWTALMRSLFGAQDVSDLVQNGFEEPPANATDVQRAALKKKNKKKDCKALFYIQQNVDNQHFEKIAKATRSKEAWDILENYHNGGEKVKQVKLQSYRRKYGMMQMEEDQKVSDYFSNMIEIVNLMKNCGENISDQMVVKKVLRSLSQKFDFIVVAIQEAKDVKAVKIEELQSSLEAHELVVIDRSSERSVQQALQVQTTKKRKIIRTSRKGRVKKTGPIMQDPKLRTKPNLLKEEVLAKIRTRRRILTRVRFSVIIVTSLDILLMNVGSRKIRKLRKPILLMKVILM